jgi:exosome complex component RRP40
VIVSVSGSDEMSKYNLRRVVKVQVIHEAAAGTFSRLTFLDFFSCACVLENNTNQSPTLQNYGVRQRIWKQASGLACKMATTLLLPGDAINLNELLTSQKRRVGHGLKQDSTSEQYLATVAGLLRADYKKKTAQIDTPNAHYMPQAGDLVIAQVYRSGMDYFQLHINSHSQPAVLHQLAFEGATKKTRPQLKTNDLVYAKVISVQKNMEVELSCVNPSTGKAEPDGLGPLTGGMVFEVSIGLAERMLKKQYVVVLSELGDRLQGGFEAAVGKNGKVWVDCPDGGVKAVIAVGRCLKETDEHNLTEREQKKLVNKIVSEMGHG